MTVSVTETNNSVTVTESNNTVTISQTTNSVSITAAANSVTVTEANNSVTVSAAGITDHGLLSGLSDDDHSQYHTDARALTWLGTRSTTDLAEGSNLYYTQARFDSAFSAKSTTDLSEGANLYYTDERVDDRVAALMTDSASISWTYNDVANTLSAAVLPGGVDHGGLAGLGDDDHSQYSLADGTRAFTGTVSGVDPTLAAHLATKNYVDGNTYWQLSANDLSPKDAAHHVNMPSNNLTAALGTFSSLKISGFSDGPVVSISGTLSPPTEPFPPNSYDQIMVRGQTQGQWNLTLGDLIIDSASVQNSATFNNSAGDNDFTIKKLTSGDAYIYDAGADTHTWSGAGYFDSTIDLTAGASAFQIKSQGTGNFGIGTGSDLQFANITTGNRNLCWGLGTGANTLTSGYENIFVGRLAGASAQSNIYNVVLGNDALATSTTASRTFALGRYSLNATTGGSNSVAIGEYSGASATTVADSILIGRSCGGLGANLFSTTLIGDRACIQTAACQYDANIGKDINYSCTGNSVRNVLAGFAVAYAHTGAIQDCVVLGMHGLRGATTASTIQQNVYIGKDVAYNCTGSGNIFLGHQAGYDLTATSNRLIIENSSDVTTPLIYGEFDNDLVRVNGSFEATGAINSDTQYELGGAKFIKDETVPGDTFTSLGVGFDILTAYIGGSSGGNFGFGQSCLTSITDGRYNFAMGVNALKDANASYSTAIGFEALLSAASNSIGIGDRALRGATGNNNVAIGNQSFSATSSGIQNVAVGNLTGTNATGSYNSAFGHRAGQDLTSGALNTLIGVQAGSNITTASSNTALGVDALFTITTSGENVALGYRAGRLSTGSGNVLIGYNAAATQTAISNQLWIENSTSSTPLVYGEFDNDFLRVYGTFQATAKRENGANVATSTTLTHTETMIIQTASGITSTLWATPTAWDVIEIRNRSGGNNTIAGNGTNIEGAASRIIYNGETLHLVFNGSEWTA